MAGGRPKGYTVESLWEAFIKYRTSVKSNPRLKVEYVGRDGDKVETPRERPLTMDGFFSFCILDPDLTDAHHYFENTDGRYEEFREITTRIVKIIRADLAEGGLLGDYNSNLTARMRGDKESLDSTVNANVQLLSFDPLEDDKETND